VNVSTPPPALSRVGAPRLPRRPRSPGPASEAESRDPYSSGQSEHRRDEPCGAWPAPSTAKRLPFANSRVGARPAVVRRESRRLPLAASGRSTVRRAPPIQCQPRLWCGVANGCGTEYAQTLLGAAISRAASCGLGDAERRSRTIREKFAENVRFSSADQGCFTAQRHRGTRRFFWITRTPLFAAPIWPIPRLAPCSAENSGPRLALGITPRLPTEAISCPALTL